MDLALRRPLGPARPEPFRMEEPRAGCARALLALQHIPLLQPVQAHPQHPLDAPTATPLALQHNPPLQLVQAHPQHRDAPTAPRLALQHTLLRQRTHGHPQHAAPNVEAAPEGLQEEQMQWMPCLLMLLLLLLMGTDEVPGALARA
mmetsp:Transcript_18919/g.52993  ORF Transcript_18919/g.52993 Transcript_18919/m.52993 type:complete len:146 (+) Transcript_18919:1762-2199(+)